MYTIILSQNKFIHKDALQFPIEERGLQFGDGVYEVIRLYGGKYYLLDDHLDRLYRSLSAIAIDFSTKKDSLKQLLLQLVDMNEMRKDGYLYLQITRGSAPRNHPFPKAVEPNLYAYLKDHARPSIALEQGVKTISLPDERWANCYIKTLNLLPNVLAKQKANEEGAYEAILYRDQVVTECSSSNVFLVKHGKIYTHPEANQILSGCVRGLTIRLAQEAGLELVEKPFSRDQLYQADELFLTSSLSEVMPIIQVDQQTIADGQPGPLTRKLQAAYQADAKLTTR